MMYRVTGDYGTFTVSKVVNAADENAALDQMEVLSEAFSLIEAGGWEIEDTSDVLWDVMQMDTT